MQRKPTDKLLMGQCHKFLDACHLIILVLKSHVLVVNSFDSMVADGDKILLRQILADDIEDLIKISFYDAIQATTLQQETAMQAKIIGTYGTKTYLDNNNKTIKQ